MSEESHSPIAPHRGFSAKAREVLIGQLGSISSGMPHKSTSDFDLRKKIVAVKKSQSPATPTTPKSPQSPQSLQNERAFDSIGERPTVKRHKQLYQIGKTKSCGDIKQTERRLIKTYQEENIIRMPSIDSELTELDLNGDRSNADFDELLKGRTYEVNEEDERSKNEFAHLNKHS